MNTKPTIKPTDMPRTLKLLPLQAKPKRGPGRPKAVHPPTPPQFEWQNDYERDLYEWLVDRYPVDYPGLKDTDLVFLYIAAAETVKYMRLLGTEIQSGELVTMARQHPGQMLARILDSLLGTTRNKRLARGDDKTDDEMDLMKLLSAPSSVA
jgi:hypothetical protein